ncbi:MAG: GerMN domain-containing protein [Ilumatobacteraceae bacterium]
MTICLGLVAVLVACGIPDTGQVTTIQDKDLRQLGDTIPPTSTSTIPPTTIVPTTTTPIVNTSTTIALDEVTVYLISGGQLRGYPRFVAKPATVNQAITALQAGPPSGDVGSGLRSAVPTRREAPINGTQDGSGVATVELPPGFFEQIPQEDQLLAIGQIVLTVTEVGGVGQVLFRQNGEPLPVPRRAPGGLTNGNEPLAHRDYEALLNPPVTTTSTIATEPPVETTVV